MARKKEFDPLGGSLGSEKPKKVKKDNTILGSKEHTGSSSIYDEVNYLSGSGSNTDALTSIGQSEKPKKGGFLSSVFGHKKSDKKIKPTIKSEYEDNFSLTYDTDVKPAEIHSYPVRELIEDDIFEEETRGINEPATILAEPSEEKGLPKTHSIIDDQPKKPAVKSHPNICYLCGADSSIPHQQFRFGGESDPESAIPLCRTCMRAVKTLMKYRDPADEQEIKSEWQILAPGLDESRANEIISEGRRHY